MAINDNTVTLTQEENGLYRVQFVLPGGDLKKVATAIKRYAVFLGEAKPIANKLAELVSKYVK